MTTVDSRYFHSYEERARAEKYASLTAIINRSMTCVDKRLVGINADKTGKIKFYLSHFNRSFNHITSRVPSCCAICD